MVLMEATRLASFTASASRVDGAGDSAFQPFGATRKLGGTNGAAGCRPPLGALFGRASARLAGSLESIVVDIAGRKRFDAGATRSGDVGSAANQRVGDGGSEGGPAAAVAATGAAGGASRGPRAVWGTAGWGVAWPTACTGSCAAGALRNTGDAGEDGRSDCFTGVLANGSDGRGFGCRLCTDHPGASRIVPQSSFSLSGDEFRGGTKARCTWATKSAGCMARAVAA